MHADRHPARNTYGFLTISLFSLLTYLTQFFLRSFDDNRLTSWQWTFQGRDAAALIPVLAASLILAFFIARVSVSSRSYPLLLFISAYGAAALFWTEPEVIVDASRYFTQAKHLELYGIPYFIREWGRGISAWTDMPLVPFLYGLVFRAFGESRIYIQILTTLFFSFSVVLTYVLGRTLWDEETGFYGGLLLLGMPYLLTQVPLMLVDIASMFFLMFAVVCFIQALQRGGLPRIIASSATIALAFYAKYSTWMMLTVLPVVFLVYIMRGEGKTKTGGKTDRAVIFSRGLAVVFIAAVFIGVVFIGKFDVISRQMRLLIDYQRPGLDRWKESFVSTFFFQIHPFITLAALYSAYVALRRKDLKYAVTVWLVVLVVLMQIKRIRYIIMVFPLLALMASYGISRIREAGIRRFLVLSVVVSSLTVGVCAYLPFIKGISTVNLKDAGLFADSLEGRTIEVFTLQQEDKDINPSVSVPLLDLFTNKDIIYAYNAASLEQPRESIEKSSLRFTWEYKNPVYYNGQNTGNGDTAVFVISERPDDALPGDIAGKVAGRRLSAVFRKSEDIFIYRPCVRVYEKKSSPSGE